MQFSTYKAHPWHGVPCLTEDPAAFQVYIEVVPTDAVKYEIDKPTGILRIDRPQKYSSTCPTLYGFLPQTYCGDGVGRKAAEQLGRTIVGDGDPLDICVLTERPITHGDILVNCIPVGGLRIVDGDEADDKIVAVLVGDAAYGAYMDIEEIPHALLTRLEHYFLTYKQFPHEPHKEVKLEGVYNRHEALAVIKVSMEDYQAKFGAMASLASQSP